MFRTRKLRSFNPASDNGTMTLCPEVFTMTCPVMMHPSETDRLCSYHRVCPEMYTSMCPVMMQQSQTDRPCSHEPDSFTARLDMQHFKLGEMSVRLVEDRALVVEAKHDEHEDEQGGVFRHFVRRYPLPHDVDTSKISCTLSSDGVLEINAPKKQADGSVRVIPITRTWMPAAVQPVAADEETREDAEKPREEVEESSEAPADVDKEEKDEEGPAA